MEKKDEALSKARNIVQNSRNIVVFTGAGISVESGIPDFRSPGGLWEKFDPFVYANYQNFLKDPTKYWELEREMTAVVKDVDPNPAHYALVELEKQNKLKAIITQNIDMLHYRAGSNVSIYELHGSAKNATCIDCRKKFDREYILDFLEVKNTLPECDSCGSKLVKFDVVLFGESLPSRIFENALSAIHRCDCLIVIGSSMQVSPANQLPLIALENGANMILVNYDETDFDEYFDVIIRGKAGDIIPQLVKE